VPGAARALGEAAESGPRVEAGVGDRLVEPLVGGEVVGLRGQAVEVAVALGDAREIGGEEAALGPDGGEQVAGCHSAGC